MATAKDSRAPEFPKGIGVVETSVLWAARQYLRGAGAEEVPDELAQTRVLFVNFLHNLLLFDSLRSDLDVVGEPDWYSDGVLEVLKTLEGVVSVGGMPSIERDEEDVFDKFASQFVCYVERNVAGIKNGSLFALPGFYYKRGLRPVSGEERTYRIL